MFISPTLLLALLVLPAQGKPALGKNQAQQQVRPPPEQVQPQAQPQAPRKILIASPGAAAKASAVIATSSVTSIMTSTPQPAATPTANLISPARQNGRAAAKAADAPGTDIPPPIGIDEPGTTSMIFPPSPATTSSSAPQTTAPQPSPTPPANQPKVISNRNATVNQGVVVVASDPKADPFAAQTASGTRLFSVTQKGGKIAATDGGAGVTGRYCCLSKAKTAICTAKQKNCRVENDIAKCGSLDANPNLDQNNLPNRRALGRNSGTSSTTGRTTNAAAKTVTDKPAMNAAAKTATGKPAANAAKNDDANGTNKVSADEPFAFENPQLADLPACISVGFRGSETASNNPRGLVLEAA